MMLLLRRYTLLFLLCGLVAGVFVWQSFLSRASAGEIARGIVEECSTTKGDPAHCYEKLVPKLFPDHSIKEIFTVIREIRRADRAYQFCHVLAHKLGEVAVAEDPTQWINVIPLNPSDGLCSNGFIHGVTVGRFRNDVLDEAQLAAHIPEFARACEPRDDWAATSLDQAICYHGMGHLFMFITNGDYRRSLDACNAIDVNLTGNFLRVCREGVFMQTYQPLEPDDFALIDLLPEKPIRDNYRRLCAQFSADAEEGACLREAWPLFRDEVKTGSGATTFCSRQPNSVEKNACFDSVFAITGRQTLAKPEAAQKMCIDVPQEEQAKCFSFVANAILEENRADGSRAIAFCDRAGDLRNACIASLASRARFVFGDTQERTEFCQLFPHDVQSSCK